MLINEVREEVDHERVHIWTVSCVAAVTRENGHESIFTRIKTA